MKTTDQIAAEADRLTELWFYNVDHSDEARKQFRQSIEAAIEKAYEQGREDEYQEWIRPNYPIRAAYASKLEVGTCTCDHNEEGERLLDASCEIHGAARASEQDHPVYFPHRDLPPESKHGV